MSNLKEIEFNKVCRTCLSSSEDMKSLYATDSGLTHVCFADMLMSFTTLKLSLNDGLSTQICSICISELNQFHTFQLKCIQSENILRNCEIKIVHTKMTSNSEEVLIKKELFIYSDNINEFELNSSNKSDTLHYTDLEIDQSCAATESLQDPLSIVEIKTDLRQELDIKHEFIGVKIENEHDININSNSSLVNLSEESTTHSSLNVTSERPYSCTVCDRGFKKKRNLNRHLVMHSGKKPHTCTVCNHSFAMKHHLTNHMLSHTGERPYACTICDRCFTVKSQLTVHLRNHSGEKPFTCTECNKSFASQQYLTSHMLTHAKEKQFACTFCVKSFTLKRQLTVHLRKHTGEKPYTCTECNKSFASQKYLRYHMLIHLRKNPGEKPYKCTICNSSFNRKGILTKHIRLHFKNSCTFCDKSFARLYLLQEHLKTHTEEGS